MKGGSDVGDMEMVQERRTDESRRANLPRPPLLTAKSVAHRYYCPWLKAKSGSKWSFTALPRVTCALLFESCFRDRQGQYA